MQQETNAAWQMGPASERARQQLIREEEAKRFKEQKEERQREAGIPSDLSSARMRAIAKHGRGRRANLQRS